MKLYFVHDQTFGRITKWNTLEEARKEATERRAISDFKPVLITQVIEILDDEDNDE